MKFFLLLMIIILAGCVKTEVAENSPDKTKTITVWDSDLKLHYDRLNYDGNPVKGARMGENRIEEEIPEFYVDLVPVEMVVDEVPTDDIEDMLLTNLQEKIETDEVESKKSEKLKKIEEKPERKKIPKKVIWIVVLVGLASFGGYFTKIKKREDKSEDDKR